MLTGGLGGMEDVGGRGSGGLGLGMTGVGPIWDLSCL